MFLVVQFRSIGANKCINEPFKKKIKTMLQFLEIIPEVSFKPSSDRWEYKEIYSHTDEQQLDFLNRLGLDGWECTKIYYDGNMRHYIGIFKRKLLAI